MQQERAGYICMIYQLLPLLYSRFNLEYQQSILMIWIEFWDAGLNNQIACFYEHGVVLVDPSPYTLSCKWFNSCQGSWLALCCLLCMRFCSTLKHCGEFDFWVLNYNFIILASFMFSPIIYLFFCRNKSFEQRALSSCRSPCHFSLRWALSYGLPMAFSSRTCVLL